MRANLYGTKDGGKLRFRHSTSTHARKTKKKTTNNTPRCRSSYFNQHLTWSNISESICTRISFQRNYLKAIYPMPKNSTKEKFSGMYDHEIEKLTEVWAKFNTDAPSISISAHALPNKVLHGTDVSYILNSHILCEGGEVFSISHHPYWILQSYLKVLQEPSFSNMHLPYDLGPYKPCTPFQSVTISRELLRNHLRISRHDLAN
jgi:hypothetical protein